MQFSVFRFPFSDYERHPHGGELEIPALLRVSKAILPATDRLRPPGVWHRAMLPACTAHLQCLRPDAVPRGEGGHPGTGPLPWRRAGTRTLLLRSGRHTISSISQEHLSGDTDRNGCSHTTKWRPHPLGTSGRVSAQHLPQRPCSPGIQPFGQRVGNLHRCRHQHPVSRGRRACLPALGSTCRTQGTTNRCLPPPHPPVCPPKPPVGIPRLLRMRTFQRGKQVSHQ